MTIEDVSLLAHEFKNEHLSTSRLKLYEQCPRAFFYRYASKGDKVEGHGAADFGKVIHAALEHTYLWIVLDEYAGAFPEERLIAFYKRAWQESSLVDVAVYQEGLDMLRAYARGIATIDHLDILACEQEFNIDVGGFVVNGYIDRVDKRGDDEIAIIDYKSNRRMFTRDELANDLQMSIYGLAARHLYPWARRVTFEFHMVRFNVVQRAQRSAGQVDDTAGYVVALGKRTETAKEWPALLNENCAFCESRQRCDKYAEAINGKLEIVKAGSLEDLEDVAREREAVASVAKAAYARKDKLDDVLKRGLSERDELHLAGRCYTFQHPHTTVYEVQRTIRALEGAGVSRADIERRLLAVDPKELETMRIELAERLDRSSALLLKANLEAAAKREPLSPRLDSRASKKRTT